jgi:phage anti-repressor protein
MPIFDAWMLTTGAVSTAPTLGNLGLAGTPTWATTTNSIYPAASLYQAMTYQTQSASGFGETIWMDANQYYALAQQRTYISRQRQEEQQRQMEVARQAAQRQQEEYMRRSREAFVRSRELLLSHLTAVQKKTFEENNWFIVEGGKSKTKYRINTDRYAGNIDIMKGTKVTFRLCVHCSDVPMHDHHLAQKLMLEYDEDHILRLANRTAA